MSRVAIFIDGAYLEYVLRDEFDFAKISFQYLSKRLAGDSEILRTYYYNCPVFQSDPPNEEQRKRVASQRRFFDAIEELPRYSVRLGRLARRGPDSLGQYSYEQKMVDILLGVDMVLLAVKGHVSEVVLLAGDSDFIPAVTAAKSEGVIVRLVHGRAPHRALLQEVDERVRITQELIDSIRLQT